MSKRTRFSRLRLLATGAAMAGMLAVAACDGENLFTAVGPGLGGGPAVGDSIPPDVEIVRPQADAQNAKPIGDSILVEVNVSDETGLSRVIFGGIAKRGDPELGTDEVVTRFQTKTVTFPPGVSDTTGLRRYLIPTPDTTRETAFLFVEAVDTLGNRASDTVAVVLGGPDVQVLNLQEEQTRSSGRLNLSILVRDPNGVEQIQVSTEGAFESSFILPISPVQDSVARDTAVFIPDGVTGQMRLTVTARSALGVQGQAGPFLVTVVSGQTVDTVAPQVAQQVTFQDRLELSDSVVVLVEGEDNPEGTGIATFGITVKAFSELGGDTLVQSLQQDFASPESGPTDREFRFAPFNVDTVALPERIIFQVTSFAVDGAGNCAANNSDDPNLASACNELVGGEFVTSSGVGQSLSINVVSGRTVGLPSGGLIQDAVVDTVRRNLFLANFDRNQVEHFDMVTENFKEAVRVGSQPWGLSINNCHPFSAGFYDPASCGDTLIVANSGGTNFSFVGLGPRPVGDAATDPTVRSFTPLEDRGNRLLTRDVVVFNFKLEESGETGAAEFVINPLNIFSDRPQFLAVDAHRRIHFSTEPTEIESQAGTIRKIFLPAGAPEEEVQMHTLAPTGTAEDSWGLLHADDVDPAPGRASQFNVNDRAQGTSTTLTFTSQPPDTVLVPQDIIDGVQADASAAGSDIIFFDDPYLPEDLSFGDTTFVAASGDGEFVLFGESGDSEVSRILIYEADLDQITRGIPVADLIINRDDQVQGLGMNYDGTLGVARGNNAYFFTPDLRLQGVVPIATGGAGAVLHPLHANSVSVDNPGAPYRPDTHLAFVASGDRTIDIYDTFHFFQLGEIAIRDVVTGPLRASLPFPGDNAAFTCPARVSVQDQHGNTIGQALEIFKNGNPDTPWEIDGGAGGNEDRCIVLKLYGVTDTGGVVVVDVRKSDILRRHPTRLNN